MLPSSRGVPLNVRSGIKWIDKADPKLCGSEIEGGALFLWCLDLAHTISHTPMASSRSLLRLLRKKPCRIPADVTSLSSALKYANGSRSSDGKSVRGFTLIGSGVSGIFSLGMVAYADEPEHDLAYPSYPWPHRGVLSSYDQTSIQREEKLFRSDCASCHGGLFSHGRAGNVAHTRKESGDMVAEIEVIRGSNDEEVLTCPRKLINYIPGQYPIELVASFGKGGGYLSDLNLITKIRERMHYNPYFSSGVTMKQKTTNIGAAEFNDGIPQTDIQMGKDLVAFSSWAA